MGQNAMKRVEETHKNRILFGIYKTGEKQNLK
jgi:hypothetical protein